MSKLHIEIYPDVKSESNNVQTLSEDFGRNLDTLEKARLWLTNPHNWHDSRLFILKWDGLLCTVNREHGARLIQETWDDGLPWSVVYTQKQIRLGRASTSGSSDFGGQSSGEEREDG